MYRPLNSNTPYATDYRGLLVAKVTAKHVPTTGVLAGRKVYEWTEQVISSAGGDEEPPQARRGVYTSATNFDNVLLDVNDADITIDSYVWARMKGVVGGATVYETVTPDRVAGTSASGCTPPGIDPDECLSYVVSAGAGRCSSITAATIGATLTGGWWVSDSTITTAAGAGTIYFQIGTTGYPSMKIVVSGTDYFGTPAGCGGTGGTQFAFGGSTLCGGTASLETCDNTFLISIACSPCGYDTCTGWYCCVDTGVVSYVADCTALASFCLTGGGGGGGGGGGTALDCSLSNGDPAIPSTLAVTFSDTIACLTGQTLTFTLGGVTTPAHVWTGTPPGDCPVCEPDFYFACGTPLTDPQLVIFGASWSLLSFTADPFRAVFRLAADTECTLGGTVVPGGSTAVVTLFGAGTIRGPFATEAEATAACAAVCDSPACTSGAAVSYTFTLTDGTTDFASANGSWTVTHTTGDTWVGVLGAWTATLDLSVSPPRLTLDGPGGAQALYKTTGDAAFTCCGTSSWVRNGQTGTGTTPKGPTLTPVGTCSGCP